MLHDFFQEKTSGNPFFYKKSGKKNLFLPLFPIFT